jgi:hypothetical protein
MGVVCRFMRTHLRYAQVAWLKGNSLAFVTGRRCSPEIGDHGALVTDSVARAFPLGEVAVGRDGARSVQSEFSSEATAIPALFKKHTSITIPALSTA